MLSRTEILTTVDAIATRRLFGQEKWLVDSPITASALTKSLQTLGLPALAEGNTIILNQARIGVVEACSGLSMLLVFFAISTGMALLVKRPWLDRLVLIASGIAVAGTAARRFRQAGTNVPTWRPTTALVASGPYRFTRNPIYIGLSAIYLGSFWECEVEVAGQRLRTHVPRRQRPSEGQTVHVSVSPDRLYLLPEDDRGPIAGTEPDDDEVTEKSA